MNKAVTVIMPCFNAENTIADSISSVLGQSLVDFELIIIDDGSSDLSVSIIERLAKRDKRIRLLLTPIAKSGPAMARNIGLENALGKHIAFLDADDIWHRDKLALQLDFMNLNGASFSCTSYNRISELNQYIDTIFVAEKINYRSLLKFNNIGCSTVVYKFEVYRNLRFPDVSILTSGHLFNRLLKGKVGHEDFAFWLLIAKYNLKISEDIIGFYPALTDYRVSRNSLSGNKLRASTFQWLIYRKVENLNLFPAIYNFLFYSLNGFKKMLSLKRS